MSSQVRSVAPHTPEPPANRVAPAAVSGHADIIRGNLARRRQGLAQQNPNAILLAAVALASGHEVSRGHVAEIRCDKPRRKRAGQLVGEQPFDLVDIVAVGYSGPVGRAVALATLGVVLAAWDCAIKPLEASNAPSLAASAAEVMEGAVRAGSLVTRALEDGRLTAAEAEAIAPHADEQVRDALAFQAEINHARIGRSA